MTIFNALCHSECMLRLTILHQKEDLNNQEIH